MHEVIRCRVVYWPLSISIATFIVADSSSKTCSRLSAEFQINLSFIRYKLFKYFDIKMIFKLNPDRVAKVRSNFKDQRTSAD